MSRTKRNAPSKKSGWFRSLFKNIKFSYCLVGLLGSAILTFGLYNIHSISNVTEGGVLGLTLLLDYWFQISPAFTSLVLNSLCYILGWKLLGREFIIYSAVSSLGFSAFYKFFELFDPIYPEIAEMPLLASLLGAVFVGVGAGLCVKIGGAPTGDDALAMGLSKLFHFDIRWVYLASDLAVLLLSLSYIPFRRIAYSLLTVMLSGQIIGMIQKMKWPSKRKSEKKSIALSETSKEFESFEENRKFKRK